MLAPVVARAKALAATAGSALKELSRIPGESARHRPHPPSDGLVLDVGGGQSAHPRANVVVDKYVVDDFERAGPLELTKPLIVADGHRLPFADGTFSYVVAMHVLEHATDPVQFASELARVAAAGFVQLPSAESELTFGWAFHPWLVDREGDTLVFRPKGAGIVPTTSSQPSFASVSSGAIWRSRKDRPSPARIRIQSRQKKKNSTIAVARCVAIRNVRKYLSFWWMSQPRRLGRMTLCPRLEIGKSSETPWSSPSTIAWG